ncbi:partial Pesticidal crystal protein Cry22Aa, partial [Methanosarcinales archaeon]
IGSTSGRLTYLPVRIYYTEAVDITPPVITLTGLSSVTVEAGSVYTDAGATAHDNIDGDLTSSIITGGLPVNTNILGPHTVTYDVTDSNGNAAIQVTRTVTVVDTTPPVITLSGSNPVTVEVGSLYIDSGATASDNIDGDITSSIVTDNPVNTALIGTYTVTYNVEDSSNNNADQKTRTVNVVDITGPEITLNGNNPETVEVGSTYTDAGAIVTDNYDTGLSATVTGTVNTAVVGVYILTYNAVDSSGNAAIAKTRTVNVVDTNTPIITLSGSNPVTVEAGSVYTDAGATALDNIDGDITSSIVTGGLPVNTSELGAHTVTYDVTDNNSNAAIQVTRTVNVVDTTPPAITLSGSSPVTIEAGSVYTDAGATALDNYDSDLTSSIVTGGLPVDTNVLGAHTVTYDVNDTSNNSAIQLIRTVTVVDTTPPVITLSGSNPVIVEAGFFVYTDAGATALDNYDGDLTSSIVTGGLPINTNIIGPHTVTYDVTDSNGNAAIRVTRTVIVSHTLPTVRYISGTVIDSAPAHTPLAGVTVSTTGGISSVTDGYGKYSLVVGQGSYPLSSSYDIRYYTNSSVTVSTTGFTSVTQDIELELKPTGTISGTVIVSV